MKTAAEALEIIAAAYHCPDVAVTEAIRLIQLDAIKEGMRRATNIARPQLTEAAYQAILTAAEQLTEKDL